MFGRVTACLLLVAAVTSCGSDDDETAQSTDTTVAIATTSTTSATSTTGVSATSPPLTTAATTPATTVPSSSGAATTAPTVPCAPTGDTYAKESEDPLAMSGLFGKDIRTGRHACFERVVIELQGSGDFPGWTVEYQDDPVVLEESNETVFLSGDATIVARFGAWMQTMESEGYSGPRDVFPTNVSDILELRLVENWEGVTRWAIGVDKERPFTVTQLTDPPRLVIDIDTTS